MAIPKTFDNTVREKKAEKKKIDKLTVLKESDRKTIYNLIFSEKKEDKGVPQM